MKNKAEIFVFVFLAALILFADVVYSSTYKVGVKVGDWAKYSYTYVDWESENPNETEPQFVKDAKNTEWIKVQVEAISGTVVTILQTIHFENDTEWNATVDGDISTYLDIMRLDFQIIAGGLSVGDIVASDTEFPINKTITKNYGGAIREVNQAKEVAVYGENETVARIVYWDKRTGILCEIQEIYSTKLEGYLSQIVMAKEMTETNMWQPGEIAGEAVAIGAAIVITIIILISILMIRKRGSKRRRKKTRKR